MYKPNSREIRSLKARRRSESIAKTSIYGAAILTIVTLFLILGFIVYRGFVANNIRSYEVSSFSEDSFDGLRIIVNSKLDRKDLTFDALVSAFSGDYIDWGKLSEQDFEMLPISYPEGSPESDAVFAALGITSSSLSPMATEASNVAEALDLVNKEKGAIALVPAKQKLPEGTKSLRVRRVVLAVNPSVTQLVGNIALKKLEEKTAQKILAGNYQNWKELEGQDIGIHVITTSKGSPLANLTKTTATSSDSNLVTEAERLSTISSTKGSVGWAYWKDASKAGLPVLQLLRTERGSNLNVRYLYEVPKMSGRVGGISTIILNTLLMIVLTILIAMPIGICAAIYLVEYAKQGRLVSFLRLGTETLAGIPSIIFGLFGMLFFVSILGWGIGLISGVLTLTLMILPTIVRTSEEALKTVPKDLREGSLALGATKLQTTLRVLVPAASPGILTGMILGIGRAVGETAALIFTMGSSYDMAQNLFSSARVLAVHIYLIIAEGISLDKAFATATVLIFIILGINMGATALINRMNTMSRK